MNNQNQLCEPGNVVSACANAALPAVSSRVAALPKARPAWKTVTRFLSQAAVGGAVGGNILLIGTILYYLHHRSNAEAILALPFVLICGGVFGILTGALTLVVENLIEEKLSALARMIVTSAIAILMVFGLATLWNSASWQLLKTVIPFGAVLGLPIGLIAGSRIRLWRVLLLGAVRPPDAETSVVSGARPISYGISLIGAFALRLVSVTGFLIAVMVLVCCYYSQKNDELMVTVYCVYYFACTAYITCCVRNRWVIGVIGTALNTALLVLALLWDPIALENGQPGPLLIAVCVLAFLWMLFAGTHRGGAAAKNNARLHPEGWRNSAATR